MSKTACKVLENLNFWLRKNLTPYKYWFFEVENVFAKERLCSIPFPEESKNFISFPSSVPVKPLEHNDIFRSH